MSCFICIVFVSLVTIITIVLQEPLLFIARGVTARWNLIRRCSFHLQRHLLVNNHRQDALICCYESTVINTHALLNEGNWQNHTGSSFQNIFPQELCVNNCIKCIKVRLFSNNQPRHARINQIEVLITKKKKNCNSMPRVGKSSLQFLQGHYHYLHCYCEHSCC